MGATFARKGPVIMMRALMSMLLCTCLLSFSSHAQDPLLSFHTPDQDFQPVDVPAWVYESPCIGFVGDDLLERAVQSGVQVVHAGHAEAYYPLRRDDPVSGLPGKFKEELTQRVARIHGLGMRFVCGTSPFAPEAVVREHADWLTHPEDNASIEEKALQALSQPDNYAFRKMCLISSPWRDYYIECLGEIMTDYKMDGISFDGNYNSFICYCRFCKESYKNETGRDIPTAVDLNNIDYRLYLLWSGDKLESWYRQLHDRLRQANSEAVLYSWTVNAGRYGHFLTLPRVMSRRMNLLFDAPMQEWWLDESNMGSTIIPAFGAAYAKAVSGHRVGVCEPYMMSRGNPYGIDSFPVHEALTRSMLVLTNGAFCAYSCGWPGHLETAFKVYDAMRAIKPWLVRAEEMPHAALLVSEDTREFYGYASIMERYLSHPLGVFRAGVEEHLPITLITDSDLRQGTLAKFRTLILANSACLSDYQINVIREYVQKGGGLIASCDTSLFDEIGRPRHDFGLKDVFGVSYQGRPAAPEKRPELDANFAITVNDEYWAKRTGISRIQWTPDWRTAPELVDDEKFKNLCPNLWVVFKGPTVKVSEPQAPWKVALEAQPEGMQERIPAVVLGTFGEGRVTYLACGFDSAYYNYGYPYQRRFLARLVEWTAQRSFPIRVEAPMCVQSTFFKQNDDSGRRIIIHLFNDLNTTSNHGDQAMDVPLREEAVPITGIKVHFDGMAPKRIHWEPKGQDLNVAQEDSGASVELPSLDVHGILVAEL